MISRLALPVISAALLAGCASPPRVETVRSAAVPDAVTAYRLFEGEAPTQTDRAAAAAVRQALAARGWREVDDKTAWRVETAYAVRPQKTGVFTDVDARDGEWTEAPRLPQFWSRRRQVHTLSLMLTGPGDAPGPIACRRLRSWGEVRPTRRRACWRMRLCPSWAQLTS